MNKFFKSTAIAASIFVLAMSYTTLSVPTEKLTHEEIVKLGVGYASAIGITAYAFSTREKKVQNVTGI